MYRLALFLVLAIGVGLAQGQSGPPADQDEQLPAKSSEPPRSNPERGPNDSSSKDAPTDLSRPQGDVREHPDEPDDVSEMRTYDPHRADKAVEIGQFYYKTKKNYPAAISRFCEALAFKPNDAIATFWLAQSLERAGDLAAALETYKAYLRILPEGPFAADSRKSIERINAKPERPSKRLEQKLGCHLAATNRQAAGQTLQSTSPAGEKSR